MTTVGRNQFLGLVFFLAAVTALGGLLFYRQQCHQRQKEIAAERLAIEAKKDAAGKTRDETLNEVTSSKEAKDGAKSTYKEAAEKFDAQIKEKTAAETAAGPKWSWLGWLLGILPIIAFMVAVNFATAHGKKFVVTLAVALAAGGMWYFRGITKGIDLSGGAELRYRMQTGEIDKKISELRKRYRTIVAGGAAAEELKTRINEEIAGLEKQKKDARDDATRTVLKARIDDLKQQLDAEELAELIKSESGRKQQSVAMAVDTIRRRIDGAGLKQVTVRSIEGGQMLVQVPIRQVAAEPGKSDEYLRQRQMVQLQADVDELQELIETPGVLGLHHVFAVENGYTHDKLISEPIFRGEKVPGFTLKKYEHVPRKKEKEKETKSERLVLRTKPVVSGAELDKAQVSRGERGDLEITVILSVAGGQKMREFTDPKNKTFEIEHDKDRLAIVMDGEVKSAPTIQSTLGVRFRITGRFKRVEADRICRVLNAGSLSYKPKQMSLSLVGPGLGQDSIDAGTRAALIGAALVVLFMGIYYLGAGLIADLALCLNLVLILGAMSALGGTMTLPGIAGIVLTVGMAVDANVLIFERIREEKLRGKPLKLAVKSGHDRALVTIMDANITTLITAFILYGFGTGPVKGFAVTLSLGIMASLFTALFVTRGFLEFVVAKGWARELKMMRLVGETKLSFMKLRPAMFVFSVLLVAGAVALFATTPDKYGLDFTGGIEVQVRFAEKQSAKDVRQLAEKARGVMQKVANEEAEVRGVTPIKVPAFSVQSFNPDLAGNSKDFKIFCQLSDELLELIEEKTRKKPDAKKPDAKKPGVEKPGVEKAGVGKAVAKKAGAATESGPPVAAGSDVERPDHVRKVDVRRHFETAFAGKVDIPMISRIGKKVAGELLRDAIMALAISVIFIFIYIVVRFDFAVGFGLGAAVALIHDAAIALGALLLANQMGLAGARIDLVIIAALLTIIGYSLNDTIVVFDRIRENRAAHRSLSLRELVDLSVNQTLSRTVLTSVTTLVAVLSILILGGGALRPFALVFTAGVLVGTYSSVFVASAVAVTWENWRDKRREKAKKKARTAMQGAR